jgi:hypothetical protein
MTELKSNAAWQLDGRIVRLFVEPDLQLAQCSGKELVPKDRALMPPFDTKGLENIDPKFYIDLVLALAQHPRFLSVTLSHFDTPSLLVDKSLLWLFGNSVKGDTDGELVPYIFGSNSPLASIFWNYVWRCRDISRRDDGTI